MCMCRPQCRFTLWDVQSIHHVFNNYHLYHCSRYTPLCSIVNQTADSAEHAIALPGQAISLNVT